MIDFVWWVFAAVSWIFVFMWLIPYFVAKSRGHRNATLVLVISVIFSIWPIWWVTCTAWVMLLIYSALTAPQVIFVQGPPGPKGEDAYQVYVKSMVERGDLNFKSRDEWLEGLRGKDADEIPLSKAGVLKPRSKN